MPTLRIAAAGDLHADERHGARIAEAFEQVANAADVVLLAGDLTAHGEPHEAEVVAAACAPLDIPVYSVLGNHDYHAARVPELTSLLEAAGVVVLERSWTIASINGTSLGIAGTKGLRCRTSASRSSAACTPRRAGTSPRSTGGSRRSPTVGCASRCCTTRRR